MTLSPRRFAVTLLGVLVAGGVGTLARYALTGLERLPSPSSPGVSWTQLIPWWLLAINAAGVLLATYALWGPLRRHDPNDLTRVLVITGLFGGLTSYSSLYEDLGDVWHVSAVGGLVVTAGAFLSGLLAAAIGIRWAQALVRERSHR